MKALQQLVHLCLVAAILLASMGFRVAVSHCSGENGNAFGLSASPDCCCGEADETPSKSCQDMSCVLQRVVASPINSNSVTQQSGKFVQQPVTYPSFTESIRPAILETIPHFTLPPPVSGRSIGILHQTFII